MRLRYHIPNTFTALSLLLGFASIITATIGQLEVAAWMIVWCGLLDVMDGLAARLLKATSLFGAEFDSMADLIAFGAAPAVLVMFVGINAGGLELFSKEFWFLFFCTGFFVLTGALRLTRFNVSNESPGGGWFTGLPITAAGAGLTATALILLLRYPQISDSYNLYFFLPFFILFMGCSMVATFRFPKMKKRKGKFINMFQGANFVASFYCGITKSYPEFLFFMGLFLLVSGIIAGVYTKTDRTKW